MLINYVRNNTRIALTYMKYFISVIVGTKNQDGDIYLQAEALLVIY